MPVSLKNNNLFGCGTLYDDSVNPLTTAAAVNALPFASSNVNFNMISGSNTYFVNETNDFHLQPGGASAIFTGPVKSGGLGQGRAVVLDLVSTDLDGNPRTGSGVTGWSMGAYEQDL